MQIINYDNLTYATISDTSKVTTQADKVWNLHPVSKYNTAHPTPQNYSAQYSHLLPPYAELQIGEAELPYWTDG
jgi:hypothetical protein